MHRRKQGLRAKGFALPTVLISSVVLLTVLAVSITSTVAVRTAIKAQYYEQMAQVAGEAGVAFAKACLAASGNIPQWSDVKPLTPSTDCTGTVINPNTYVTSNGNIRSGFSVGLPSTDTSDGSAKVLVVGGGGGGGMDMGGGGGGGGVVYNSAVTLSPQTYTVTVGAGGPGAPAANTNGQNAGHQYMIPASNGSNSVFAPAASFGSSSATAGKSCYSLKLDGIDMDGVYWIDPDQGGANSPFQVWCDMNYAGGGWTLLMKATRGTTFNYNATYWTTANVLNDTQTNLNDGYAKFRSFNESSTTDVMARWPDVNSGYRWLHNNAWTARTALTGFNEYRNWGNHPASPYYNATWFSAQTVQGANPGPSAWGTKLGDLGSGFGVRWGFRYNENGPGNYASDDVQNGIGMTYGSYSAGDYYGCCGTTGMNRSARVEVYGRNIADTADIAGAIVAVGGGAGGSSLNRFAPGINGRSGGSGGGAGGYNESGIGGVVYAGGAGTSGQGNAGGNSGSNYYSGGGGGAGGAGVSGNSQAHGGNGVQYSAISSYTFGGGGGGSGYSVNGGVGGTGGGGGGAVGSPAGGANGINPGGAGGGGSPVTQANTPGGNGGANTGGGGGGGAHCCSNNKGGDGGSGIVIISYRTGKILATGGTVTISGDITTHTFTSSSNFVVTSTSNRAISIPNTGYVELLRNSTGQVWRRYEQKAAPPNLIPFITNLATNPSVEETYNDWGLFSTAGSTSNVRTTGGAPFGNYYSRMTILSGTGGAGGVYHNNIPVVGGNIYTGSLYVKTNNAKNISMGIEYYNAAGAAVAYISGTSTAISNTWTRIKATGTAPSTATRAVTTAYVSGGSYWNTGDVFDTDGWMLTQGPTLYDYADGTFSGWQWSAAANGSASSGLAGTIVRSVTSPVAKVLVVAGGGSGGGSQGTSIASGGGGAGGVVYNNAFSLTPQAYTVTVGAGGTGVSAFAPGNNGQNSSFGGITAIGGGYGGTWNVAAAAGGSGGASSENGQNLYGASGTPGQGNTGGTGSLAYDSGATSAGSGGGGAGANGSSQSNNTLGGSGGMGRPFTISGSLVYYGGGGGGAGSATAGGGGLGGGGAGRGSTTGTGSNGSANTGGGGGGSLTNANEAVQPGGNGGSGIVIISYFTGSMLATGGTITYSNGNTIHTFTSSGTFTVTSVF